MICRNIKSGNRVDVSMQSGESCFLRIEYV